MEQAMKAMSAKMDGAMAGMDEQMKDMPEEQRKMMEQMMGGQMSKKGASKVEMVKTGETKTLLGYSCYKCVAKEGDKELMSLWVTKGVRGFENLRKDYEALTRRMMSMNPSFMKGLADAMIKIDGFPLEMDWGGMTTLVTKVETRSTSASEFAVPAGFTKVDSPLMKME
jgi:hypothetical protein